MIDTTTFFLLRLWGPILVIVGLSILLHGSAYAKLLKELSGGFSLAYYLVAVIPLTIRMAMVLVHNRWDTAPEVLVSLLGWGALLKGAIRLLLPDVSKSIIAAFTTKNVAPWALIVVAWGAAMTWLGYAWVGFPG